MNAPEREPRIVAVAHQKGGTGKTTTVCNLAASFASRDNGLRVIVIDLDPQAAASIQLSDDDLSTIGAYDVIVAGHVARAAIQNTKIKNCLLIPATDRLVMSEMDAATRAISFEEVSQRLRENLQGSDLIILDCPAGFGTIATMAMTIADLVVVPTPPLLFESRALSQTIEHVERLRVQARSRLAVVLTMIDPANAAQAEIAEEIRSEWRSVLVPVEVPRDPVMDAAVLADQLLVDYDSTAPAAHAYRSLAADLGRRVGFDLPDVVPPVQEPAATEAPAPTATPQPETPPPPKPIDHGPVPELFRKPPSAVPAPAAEGPPPLPADPPPADVDNAGFPAPRPPSGVRPHTATEAPPPPPPGPEPAVPPASANPEAQPQQPSAPPPPPPQDETAGLSASAPAAEPAPHPDPAGDAGRPGIMAVLWRIILIVALMAVAGVATFLVMVDIGFLPWVLGAALILLIIIFPAILFRLF